MGVALVIILARYRVIVGRCVKNVAADSIWLF